MKEDDPPITPAELFQLRLIRIGKPPMKAAPMKRYFDPQHFTEFKAKHRAKGKR